MTAINSASVTYDANQNATSITGNTYGYDAANRLTSATPSGGSAASFVFDPLSRLASSTVSSTTTRYQYAGVQLAAEYDASGAVTRRYVPGLGLDGVVTAYTGSGFTTRDWLLADERGSVVALTGSTGVVSTINRYDEYGTPNTANAGRFGYTGQAWMAEAAAWHYRARAYLPGVGRFLQTDPIRYGAGMNLYAYVGADPVNYTDPLGLQEAPPVVTLPGATVTGISCAARGGHYDEWDRCVANITSVTIWTYDFTTSYAGFQDGTGGGGGGSPSTAAQRECEAYLPNDGKFVCNAQGRPVITPEYQEQVCRNMEALQSSADIFGDSITAGDWVVAGGATWWRGPPGAIIVGGLMKFADVVASSSTGSGFRPFGYTLIPRVEVEGC